MIFGKRGVLYRLILVHLFNTFSLSYLLRLLGALVGSVLRSRREAELRRSSAGSHILRKIYSHIVAQGLGAEKLTAFWGESSLPRNGVSKFGQVGMASVIVLLLWVYWPAEAAAPEQPLAADAPALIESLSAAGAIADSPEAPSVAPVSSQLASPQQIEETRERFAARSTEGSSRNNNAQSVAPSRPQLASPADGEPNQQAGSNGQESDSAGVPYPAEPGPVAHPEAVEVVIGPSRPDGLADLLTALVDAASRPRETAEQLAAQAGDAPASDGQASPSRTDTAIPQPTPTPAQMLIPGRQWADFTPAAAPAVDHFWLGQPHPSGYNQFYSPNYQFGSTAGDRYRIHHGVDISNDAGAPVLAMGEGEVVHAGPDNPALLGPYNNFYGNAVVIRLNRRLPTFAGEQDVYVLLGHLSEVFVERGQQVTPDVVVGAVGMTGIAIGPHLHVEVRVGQNSYLHSVNPALWMQNPPGTGSVAVRLLTADGRSWPLARLSLLRYEGGSSRWVRTIEIYPDAENIGPDPSWGENGALSYLAAGAYWIGGVINGEKVGQNITIYPGETAFVELRTQQ